MLGAVMGRGRGEKDESCGWSPTFAGPKGNWSLFDPLSDRRNGRTI